MSKLSSVSIVIPVYNEAGYLPACLDAIARQTVRPYEVIVVDNNSTDETVALAERYDFVTVIHENRQGVVYARDTGFNAARGNVIGRIDGDTLIAPNWVETVQKVFEDKATAAVSGEAHYYDVALSAMIDFNDSLIRKMTARIFGDKVALQGANMAMRRSVWREIRKSVCHSGGMHEDFDLAVHCFEQGHKNTFNPDLKVNIGYRQAKYGLRDFITYAMLSPKTYTMHGQYIGMWFYPMIVFVILCYPLLRILSRGYDPRTEKFSWERTLTPEKQRVNPATYGDY